MFRTLSRLLFPNPFDRKLKALQKSGKKKILLGWNRGLGDIPLGLFLLISRIRDFVPDAEVTFLVRKNLEEGMRLLSGVETLVAPSWKRGHRIAIEKVLKEKYDLVIENPDPTAWVPFKRGVVTPRLAWDVSWDSLEKKFDLPEGYTYIGAQVLGETGYGLWRNWPLDQWIDLLDRLEKVPKVKVLLFGVEEGPKFPHKNVIDLRGKTTLFELLSIVKNRCSHVVLPDSGVLSILYYLDVEFPLQVISLWADPFQGVLKQAVASPNPGLKHIPLIGEERDSSNISVLTVFNLLFPVKPLIRPLSLASVGSGTGAGAVILAGGQGSRLQIAGPKGVFPVAGKSLFEWIVTRAPKENFPIAIMTSPLNREETIQFFQKHQNFGRELYFFQQPMIPLKGMKTLVPDGNGSFFKAFVDSGLWTLFSKRGVDRVNIVPVENPLADPADGALIQYGRETRADVVIKSVVREKVDEKMGVLVERCGRIEILEYLHLDREAHYIYNNTGMMNVSLPFILNASSKNLPIHWVEKKVLGKTVLKGERFIFDALPLAERVEALLFPREICYAPMKSLENLPRVEQALGKRTV